MRTADGVWLRGEAGTGALRVTQVPKDVDALGAYSLGVATGVLPAALGANSEIFQFRYVGTKLAVVRRVLFSAVVSTTFFAAGVPVQVELRMARAWSADGTGGVAIVFSTANTNKKRTGFALSGLSDTGVRIATTAALGAGTKTLDTNALTMLVAPGPLTGSLDGAIIRPGTPLWGGDEHPLVLGPSEGLVIRSVAVPGTGTWTAAVTIEWDEQASL